MISRLAFLISLFCITFVIATCQDESTVTLYTDNLDIYQYPVVTCNNFATPTVPVGATTVPLLVIRIQFAGDAYDKSYAGNPYEFKGFYSDACTWAKKIFYNTAEGQLNHYFNSVSYNAFHLTPAPETHDNNNNISDGIITVTLSGNHPNPQSSGYFHQKLATAISQADQYIDFSAFDTNSNGIINRDELQVMYLVAGYESATISNTSYPSVWAHKWCLAGQEGVYPPTLDGVSLLSCTGNGYSRFGERHFENWNEATIGIIAHELGHAIWTLPDLYDPDGSSAGIGNFGLMGSGSWGYETNEKPGETPVHPSAWVKSHNKWVTTALAVATTYNLRDTDQTTDILKVDITSDTQQYFLIENRATTGYDKGLYILDKSTFGGGLAIWHIDESRLNFTYPNANDSRRLVDLEEANNPELDLGPYTRGTATNLFYDGNSIIFNDSSTPNSKDNSGAASGVDISGIGSRLPTMTLTVN